MVDHAKTKLIFTFLHVLHILGTCPTLPRQIFKGWCWMTMNFLSIFCAFSSSLEDWNLVWRLWWAITQLKDLWSQIGRNVPPTQKISPFFALLRPCRAAHIFCVNAHISKSDRNESIISGPQVSFELRVKNSFADYKFKWKSRI